jgi:hypothetical protein
MADMKDLLRMCFILGLAGIEMNGGPGQIGTAAKDTARSSAELVKESGKATYNVGKAIGSAVHSTWRVGAGIASRASRLRVTTKARPSKKSAPEDARNPQESLKKSAE